MHYEIIITFILSSLALTISPGPDILYVISQSFIKGKKQAIITSLGLTTGLLFHTFLVVIGLSLLLKENEKIFLILKTLGALYFIYLAIKAFLNRQKENKKYQQEIKNISIFKKGLLMNLLNPKVSIFFIALFPNFLFHDNLDSQIQFTVLGILFWIQANLVFISVSFFAVNIKSLIDSKGIFNKYFFLIETCIYIFISIWILK
jgi:threonine/homoserine/homoserine lactone efflux protein|tara:strand:+ start:2445 stop:3056 length:612 start_codon:yes stop_codon:yes gene_type:complete